MTTEPRKPPRFNFCECNMRDGRPRVTINGGHYDMSLLDTTRLIAWLKRALAWQRYQEQKARKG